MVEFDNSLSRNTYFINRSSINRKQLDIWNVPKQISVKSVQNSFDKVKNKKQVLTGVGENSQYIRHTNYVKVDDLLTEIVKDNKQFLDDYFRKK